MTLLERGYTGHEHLPEFGLINMNGRMYDPLIGRMLSPDPFVQGVGTQGYNGYSYARNNPLSYTDPTGEVAIAAVIISAFIGGMVNAAANFNRAQNSWQLLGYFGVGALAGALGAHLGVGGVGVIEGAMYGVTTGAATGFVGGAGNALVNGANSYETNMLGMNAFMGGIMGGMMGGIAGLNKANKLGFDPWTGTGWVESSKVSNGFVPEGDPTGFGLKEPNLTQHATDNYSGSGDYLNYASCTIEDMYERGGMLFDSRTIEGDQLMKVGKDGIRVAEEGVIKWGRSEPFEKFGAYVLVSPNVAGYSGNLHQALGHELIHGFHGYMSLIDPTFNLSVSESDYLAYRWNYYDSGKFGYRLLMNNYISPIWRPNMYPSWVKGLPW
jgi:RHS repeat-associated protein